MVGFGITAWSISQNISVASNDGCFLVEFSLDNWAPTLTNGWLSPNIFLVSSNSAFNAQMVDIISWVSNSKLFSRDLVNGTQLFERENALLQCYVLPSPTVGQHEIFLLEISTQSQTVQKPKQEGYFPKWYGVLGGVSKAIPVVEWYLHIPTCITRFLYLSQNLLSYPAARSSSNSSSNIPRCDANEPTLFFPLPKDNFSIHIRMVNPWESPQVYYLLLTTTFFFTESTDQRLKYILKAVFFHIFSQIIGGTAIFW